MSVEPPGAKPTRNRIGFVGKVCAASGREMQATTALNIERAYRFTRVSLGLSFACEV